MIGAKAPQLEIARELGLKAVELLGNGEWHPYAKVTFELMKVIPPGIAIRRAERLRGRPRKNQGIGQAPSVRRIQRTAEELVTIGQRNFVTEFLRHETTFEIDYSTDVQRVRMIKIPRHAAAGQPGMPRALSEKARLLQENEHLRDQVANLRIYLIGLGHEKRANEIAPPNDEG